VKIVALCTLSTGLNTIEYAMKLGVSIDKIIGLNPKNLKNKKNIAGYIDIKKFCIKHKIDYAYVDKYSLKKVEPTKLFSNADIIWVAGWQRLIPENFISFPKICSIGAHGSLDGIRLGRGRSPQNWALLMGAKYFKISVFKISKGIDDGNVIASKKFKLNSNDTIKTSYKKMSACVAQILFKLLKKPLIISKSKKQVGRSEYFPKRTPEDGFIDWNMSVLDVYNLIRSLAEPYPNAMTYLGKKKIYIKDSKPTNFSTRDAPGKIFFKYPNGIELSKNQILVSTKDKLLLIKKYTPNLPQKFSIGKDKFNSVNMQLTINNIMKRFKIEFPKKKLNTSLKKFWNKKGFKV
tara:strand:- start:277 stop:1320 length:1044 start_codon:yes stop_codon:yes gene_type:complete